MQDGSGGRPVGKPSTSGFVWLIAMVACLSAFLFGYDTGVVSAAMLWIPDELHLTYTEQELVGNVHLPDTVERVDPYRISISHPSNFTSL